MFGGLILAAMLEADERVFSEGHEVGKQKAVSGFDLVLLIFCLSGIACAGRMSRKRERHILAAPIISAPAPFFGAGALGLRRLAVIKEKPWIAFECIQDRAIGKNPRGADQ